MKRAAPVTWALFGGLLPLVCFAASPAEERVRAAIPRDQTIQVVLNDQVLPDRDERWTSQAFSMDREGAFISAFRAAWRQAGIRNKLQFDRFAAGTEENPPSLHVTLQRWRTTPPRGGPSVFFDMLISAELRLADRAIELGNFSAQESHLPLGQLDADDFQKVADEVVTRLIEAVMEVVELETGAAD